jgi:hypothetical protein
MADGVIRLLNNEPLRKNISSNTLQKIVSTAWENSAVAHVKLLEKITGEKQSIQYNLPEIKLDHLKQMTTKKGIIQFSKINQPDIDSGYTLDDNARALITMCMHYKLTGDETDLEYIQKYISFIDHCQQPAGDYLNYVDKNGKFTGQNKAVNLDDANGRAFWALGYTVSLMGLIPREIVSEAITIFEKSLPPLTSVHSTRAMAFVIKGLYYYNKAINSPKNLLLLKTLAIVWPR